MHRVPGDEEVEQFPQNPQALDTLWLNFKKRKKFSSSSSEGRKAELKYPFSWHGEYLNETLNNEGKSF